MKKRDNSIDIVKGWGIILVIWGHTSHFLFNEIYAFHMPLFFFFQVVSFHQNYLSEILSRRSLSS